MDFKHFRAKVPIEKYDGPGKVEVHFFAGGKARVVAGKPVREELNEEIISVNAHAFDLATPGQLVGGMFTSMRCTTGRSSADKRMEGIGNERGNEL
jgi:hypothetical protein